MAKALVGHVGIGTDLRLATEVRRLRAQVAQVQAECARLRAENVALAAAVTLADPVPDDLSGVREAALT